MKTFFSFLLVLVFAGYIFFSGWLSFWSDPSRKNVIITKTSGVLERIVSGADFFWTWQGILPTNVSYVGFRGQSWTESFRLLGKLPRSSYYASFLGIDPGIFDFNFQVRLELEWDPEKLPDLVRRNTLTQEILQSFEDQLRTQLEQRVRAWIEGSSGDYSPVPRLKKLDPANLALDFMEKNRDVITGLSLQKIIIAIDQEPDWELYEKIKQVVASIDNLILEQQQARSLTRRLIAIRENEKRELLAQYGELFEKYPSLVTFLSSPAATQISDVLPSITPPETPR